MPDEPVPDGKQHPENPYSETLESELAALEAVLQLADSPEGIPDAHRENIREAETPTPTKPPHLLR